MPCMILGPKGGPVRAQDAKKARFPGETEHFTQDIEINDTGTAVYFSLC